MLYAAAVKVKRAEATTFWRALTTGTRAGTDALGSGVTKLRLDRKIRASLDQSVPQIGAPEAWRAGLDGAGVTVAVLDTGIDTTHPDFAGRITGSRNFTPDPDARDGFGHASSLAESAFNRAVQTIARRIDIAAEPDMTPIVVFNPHPWPLHADVEFEFAGYPSDQARLTDDEGAVGIATTRFEVRAP